jgi:hypothetical protein
LFFFSREESRIHIHLHPDGEVKFWLASLRLATSTGFHPRITDAQRLLSALKK